MSPRVSPRELLASPLAPDAPIAEALSWAVAHATLAPSELNSQPWHFRAVLDRMDQGATIELLLDRARLLPTIDPTDREAVLACGGALLNLRLALGGAALSTTVRLCPDPYQADLLADVTVRSTVDPRPEEPAADRELRRAVVDRTTHRAAFELTPVAQSLVDQLVAEVGYEGAPVVVLNDSERRDLGRLNREATTTLWPDRAFREELASWSRNNATSRTDGVPGFAHGLGAWQSWLEPGRLRAGSSTVLEDEDLRQTLEDAGVTVVIGAASESRIALLRAGAGMQRLLLRATSHGVAASYRNAALHVPGLRQSLSRAVQLDHPQVVLRLGYAERAQPSARRSQGDVLDLHEVH